MIQSKSFVFFGSAPFSIICLEALKARGIIPELIVSLPDAPQGRGRILSPNIVTTWAKSQNIAVLTPEKIKENEIFKKELSKYSESVILVAAYGKIIPPWLLDVSPLGILNIHPSLLPKYRGPSPIQSHILRDDSNLGVTIMRMDTELDHGPIIAQRPIMSDVWPLHNAEAETLLGEAGSVLFIDSIADYIANQKSREQDHSSATFTQKFNKQDGLIDLGGGRSAFCRFCAFHRDPGCFFFDTHSGREIRIKIIEAKLEGGTFTPLTIVPEGKKSMEYSAYLRGKHA